MNLERVELVAGLDLPALLARVEAGGGPVILTRDGADVLAVARPGDLEDAELALHTEALEREWPAIDRQIAAELGELDL